MFFEFCIVPVVSNVFSLECLQWVHFASIFSMSCFLLVYRNLFFLLIFTSSLEYVRGMYFVFCESHPVPCFYCISKTFVLVAWAVWFVCLLSFSVV